MNLTISRPSGRIWLESGIVVALSVPLGQWSVVDSTLRGFLENRRGVVYPAIVGLEGTILGFVIASLTIVIGYVNSPRFAILKGTRHWEGIFVAFAGGAKWTAGALVFALAALFFDRDSAPNTPLSMMLFISALLAAVRVGRVLYVTEKVVKVIVQARPREAGA
jgi:hypothetical protein